VRTIILGENNLALKRDPLKPSIAKVEQLIRERLMSKKNPITKINRIVTFIAEHTSLSKTAKKLMRDCLSHLSIENEVIMSIFTADNKPSNSNSPTPETPPNSNPPPTVPSLQKQIAEVLKNYCLTKCKLIKISQ
jgi:hypothetical protein